MHKGMSMMDSVVPSQGVPCQPPRRKRVLSWGEELVARFGEKLPTPEEIQEEKNLEGGGGASRGADGEGANKSSNFFSVYLTSDLWEKIFMLIFGPLDAIGLSLIGFFGWAYWAGLWFWFITWIFVWPLFFFILLWTLVSFIGRYFIMKHKFSARMHVGERKVHYSGLYIVWWGLQTCHWFGAIASCGLYELVSARKRLDNWYLDRSLFFLDEMELPRDEREPFRIFSNKVSFFTRFKLDVLSRWTLNIMRPHFFFEYYMEMMNHPDAYWGGETVNWFPPEAEQNGGACSSTKKKLFLAWYVPMPRALKKGIFKESVAAMDRWFLTPEEEWPQWYFDQMEEKQEVMPSPDGR